MNELRQTKIKLLNHAIENMDKFHGICYALEDGVPNMTDKSSLTFIAWDELTDYILNALGSHFSYSGWVSSNYPNFCHNGNSHQGRIAWCRWMIQCLEEDEAKENAK